MRRYRFVAAALLILTLVAICGLQVSSAKDQVRRFTMESGARVILEENRTSPVVALQIWVEVGSADEKDDEAGMCHFIEHMLFKGTEKKKVREMAKEIESLGGTINANTSYDRTVYHVTIASRYANAGLDLLVDAIRHSTFDPVELEREREVILEEVRMGEDDPARRLFKQTMAAAYRGHPYRRPVIGFEKTLRAITRDQMLSFFKKGYQPGRMVFIAVGDFDIAEMEAKMRETLGDFRSQQGVSAERAPEPGRQEFRSVIAYGGFKETYLQVAFPIGSAKDEDTPALDVLSSIIGGGETSRLVQKVKLEKGLVHSVSASSFTPKDPGLFVIGATLDAGNVERALEAILEEVSRLGRDGVTSEELHRVKVNVESALVYDRQTVQGMARKIGYYELITGDVQFEKEYLRRIALLRSEGIQKVVEKYLTPSRMVVSILAPSEKEEVLRNVPLRSVAERWGAAPSSAGEKEPPILRTVLENGLRLIVKENRSLPVVSVQASFLGGVRFEEEARNGINQFMAVMATKGTGHQNSLEIAKKVEKMAGSMSGFSGYNSFGLTFTFLSQHFDEALSLFAEVLKDPSFDQDEMEKRRRSTLAAIRQQEDQLGREVFRLFRKTIFESHPYRMSTLGTLDSIQKLTRADLMEYYGRIVLPENMVLVVVGDVDPGQVLSAAGKFFGDMRRGSFTPPSIPSEPPLNKIRKSEIYKTKEQAHLVLGFSGTTFYSKDRYALEVLDAALSGQGGRLFRKLRDEESLAYSLDFINDTNMDTGHLGVYMGTHPDKLDKAITMVLGELRKVKEEGITEDEVERAKKFLIGTFEISLQTNDAQANHMSLDELYGLGFDRFRTHSTEIEKVSKEDVDRVAARYINLEAYALALIRPPLEKKE